MNMAIRGIDANLGQLHAGSFHDDQHPDLRADYILANPPFNTSKWGADRLADDVRWKFGKPQDANANFAWIQHIIHHLAPEGVAAVVLANGSLSSNHAGAGAIRRSLVLADLVDCVVWLPAQLFYSTQIAVCIWVLTRAKAAGRTRNRQGETLFVDARHLGRLDDRTHKSLSKEEISLVAGVYKDWCSGEGQCGNIPGLSATVSAETIEEHGFSLVPGRYVSFACEQQPKWNPEDLRELLSIVQSRSSAAESLTAAMLSVVAGLSDG